MQSVPKGVILSSLREQLEKVPGVVAVHDLHVWQLVGAKIIGTVHIVCLKKREYMKIATEIKDIFHKFDIHSSTIQPEFIKEEKEPRQICQLDCGTGVCITSTCCPKNVEPAIDEEKQDIKIKKRH